MREFFDCNSLLDVNDSICVAERVCVGGYEYTKTTQTAYENYASIITICDNFATIDYKVGSTKNNGYNPFGQRFK